MLGSWREKRVPMIAAQANRDRNRKKVAISAVEFAKNAQPDDEQDSLRVGDVKLRAIQAGESRVDAAVGFEKDSKRLFSPVG